MNPDSITANSFTLEKRVGAVAVAAGWNHTLVLKGDGTVISWGYQDWPMVVPAGLSDVVQVAAGNGRSLALKSDGTVIEWTDLWNGGTGPAGLSNVVAIAAGPSHNLALKGDGTVVAWGDNYAGQTAVPTGLTGVKAVAAGASHSLALKEDGTVVEWGSYYGQVPVPPDLSNVVAIAAGGDYSLALKSDGTVVAWGGNSEGAVVPPGLTGVVAISAAQHHAVALKSDGTVIAWGYNYDGRATVPDGLSNVVAISTQAGHTVALKGDGSVVAWGKNDQFQATIPTRITGAVAIAGAEENYLAALKSDGTVAMWGNSIGSPEKLGGVTALFSGETRIFARKSDGTITPVTIPGGLQHPTSIVPNDLTDVVAVASSYAQVFAVKADGTVVTWGGGSGWVNLPEGLNGISDIAASSWAGGYVMALKADGTVLDVVNNAVIAGLTNVVDIAVGPNFSVALKADGTVVAWGDNSYGGTHVPAGLTGVIKIAAGNRHVLALKSDGTVVTWGQATDGTMASVPEGLSDVVDIATTYFASMALKSDGTIVVWGATLSGQLSRLPEDPYYSKVAATVAYNNASKTATLTPSDPLETQTVYRATVFGRSSNGTPMAGSQSWTFTTGATMEQFVVTAAAGNFGSISPAQARLVPGGTATSFTVTPAAGYKIAAASGCNGTLNGSTYTTGPVASACNVQVAFGSVIDKPLGITAPTFSSVDASYSVSWLASPTPGVNYVLEEATNSSFTAGLRTVYSGAALTAEVTGNAAGTTYYYRIKAISNGYPDSAWTIAANGTTLGVVCAAGTYLPPRENACLAAPAGHYVATSGQSSATACPAGTYQPDTGQQACLYAPAGSFVAATAQTAATPCAPGTFQNLTGQNSCIAASVGYHVATSGQSSATACPAGTYQPDPGQQNCLDAPIGHFVATAGQGVALACPLGTAQPLVGQTACNPCTAETYADATGLASCTACPAHTSQRASGSSACYADYDDDGIADITDTDDDGDGIPDATEIANDTDPLNPDIIAPNLIVSTLANGARTKNAALNITGSATDETLLSGLTVNGEAVTVQGDGSYSTVIGLLPGNNTITVAARDGARNRTIETRTIILDQQVPGITITTPADNSITAQSFAVVSGRVDEEAEVKIVAEGESIYLPNRDGKGFNAVINLREGLNTIIVNAVDLALNPASAKRTVTYDPLAPGLSVSSPAEDVIIRDGLITIGGQVKDTLSAVSVTISVDGQLLTPAISTNGSFASDAITLTKEGTWPVIVTATDAAGNRTTVTRNILYTRGLININQGAEVTASTTVTLALDYSPGAPKMRFCSNNLSWTAWEAYATTKNVTLPAGNGVTTIYVQFLDTEGRETEIYFDSIRLDTIAPVGEITINNGAATTTDAVVTLTLAVTDLGGVAKMQFSNNGTTWTALEPFTATKTWTLDGTYGLKTVYARFVDRGGKTSLVLNDTISYSASIPAANTGQITIKGDAPYTTIKAVPLTITVPDGSYTQMTLSLDGSTWLAWGAVTANKTVSLPAGEGIKTVYAQFKTTGGTLSPVYSDTIILDSKAPFGTIVINNGNLVTASRTLNLTLHATDLNGVSEMQFSENGTIWSPLEPYNTSRSYTLLPDTVVDGSKKIYVRFKDSAGNVSKATSAAITLDRTAPVGTVKINAGTSTLTSLQATLTLTATGAINMQLSLDGGTNWGAWEPFATSKVVTLPAGDGLKVVLARFRDLAGNTSATTASASASLTTASAPGSLTVPTSDPDGAFSVHWAAVVTPGISYTYTLEEATNAEFTIGKRIAYSGNLTSAPIKARVKGATYYYRVRTDKSGWVSSTWTLGNQECRISPALPAGIKVPALDNDGSYDLSWTASVTPGVSYEVERSTDSTFASGTTLVYSGSDLKATLPVASTTPGVLTSFYHRVRATKPGYVPSDWKNGLTPCKVGSPIAPANLTIPASDPDGTYNVTWSGVAMTGVTYTLEEATDANFTSGKRTAYTGTLTSASIKSRVKGVTYYYRVQTNLKGLPSSSWATGTNGCKIGVDTLVAPAGIVVPATDADGTYTITWSASATPGVTYVVEEATDSQFANRIVVYSGTDLTLTRTGQATGTTYFYRVKSIKTGLPDSTYRQGTVGCTVALAPLTTLFVPVNTTGSYTVSWSPSTDTGVSYELQEATNSAFTSGLRSLPATTETSISITGRTPAKIYYYRIRATKPGFTATAWVMAAGSGGTVLTGILYDSAVGGVQYTTASQSGVTDALGSFKYIDGEVVTFQIGNFILGQAKGAPLITPASLLDASGAPVDLMIAIRLLQTLDADNNPANGITIPADNYPTGHLSDITSEAMAQKFLNSLASAKTLIAEATAVTHFTSSMDNAPDTSGTPAVAVAPINYTKLRAATTTTVNDGTGILVPNPICSLDHVGDVTVTRSSAIWTPVSVTVHINQSDYVLPGPGNSFTYENDSVRVKFTQPILASGQQFPNLNSTTSLFGWEMQQKYDYGMGVVSYFDKSSQCSYQVLVRDETWYAPKNDLTPRVQLSPRAIGLDGCPVAVMSTADGGGAGNCSFLAGVKWFSYDSGVFDPDGYVARLDWKVDLDGTAWISGTCQAGVVGKGETVQNNGKVKWSCDAHNQVRLLVEMNWLNPATAEGYPEHKVTLTPYDDKLQKGAEASLTVAGKPAPASSTSCVQVTYPSTNVSESFCVNSDGFRHGEHVSTTNSGSSVLTYNGGCLLKTEFYIGDGSSIEQYSSTCQPNIKTSSAYPYTGTSKTYNSSGELLFSHAIEGDNYISFLETGLAEWCAGLSISGIGFCQNIASVTIPPDIAARREAMPGNPASQCPAGQTLTNGVCIDSNGCFLVDPNKLGVTATRGNFFLGNAKVTLTNSSNLRVVAAVGFPGGFPSEDTGQIPVPANSSNSWTGGYSGLTGYKVEFWGSTKPANDWVCHKPQFTQVKTGSL